MITELTAADANALTFDLLTVAAIMGRHSHQRRVSGRPESCESRTRQMILLL